MQQSELFHKLDAFYCREWDHGYSDCIHDAADIFLDCFGIDPIKGRRGDYKTILGAHMLAKSKGGFLKGCTDTFISNDLVRGKELGCIGIMPSGLSVFDGFAACVYAGNDMWACKAQNGYSLTRLEMDGWVCRMQDYS